VEGKKRSDGGISPGLLPEDEKVRYSGKSSSRRYIQGGGAIPRRRAKREDSRGGGKQLLYIKALTNPDGQ